MTTKRAELARRRAQAGFTQESMAEHLQIARATVARWERGEGGLPYPRHRPRLAQALGVSGDELERLFGLRGHSASAEANRRQFITRTGEAMVLGIEIRSSSSLVELIDRLGVIAGNEAAPLTAHDRKDSFDPAQALVTIKQAYQACDHAVIGRYLPVLLRRLENAPDIEATTQERHRAQAYHVLASVFFKLGSNAEAVAAGGASMAAARLSDDPLFICSSGRALVQALDTTGEHRQAAELSISLAEHTEAQVTPRRRTDPVWLSVYGSLLLRGAMAAAAAEDSALTAALLDEAAATAAQLGTDANYEWTAFGPTNVMAHRVAAEYALGNAGSAVQQYQKMDVTRLCTAERKTTVLLDIGRSYVAWGKFDEAMEALTQAEQLGPQEFRRRPTTQQAVRTMLRTASPSQQPAVTAMANRVGLVEVT